MSEIANHAISQDKPKTINPVCASQGNFRTEKAVTAPTTKYAAKDESKSRLRSSPSWVRLTIDKRTAKGKATKQQRPNRISKAAEIASLETVLTWMIPRLREKRGNQHHAQYDKERHH
jgi:hypothetical protein